MTQQPNSAPAPAIFQFQSAPLRVETDEQGNPWFLAKDVCDILGYANHNEAIKYHCKEKGVAKCYPLQTTGGTQYPLFINEGNLYRLTIKSNKPEAEPFESWVCDEVLPSIRKTGSYQRPVSQRRLTVAVSREITRLAQAVTSPKANPLEQDTAATLLQDLIDQHGLSIDIQKGLQQARDEAKAQDTAIQTQRIYDQTALVQQFFTACRALIDKCHLINHSKQAGQLAVNPVEIYRLAQQRGIAMPSKHDLMIALSQCPDLINSNKSIQSVHTRKVLKCWVFKIETIH